MSKINFFFIGALLLAFSSCMKIVEAIFLGQDTSPKKEQFKYYDPNFKIPIDTNLKSNKEGFYYYEYPNGSHYEIYQFLENGTIDICNNHKDSINYFPMTTAHTSNYGIYTIQDRNYLKFSIRGYYYRGEIIGGGWIYENKIAIQNSSQDTIQEFYFQAWR